MSIKAKLNERYGDRVIELTGYDDFDKRKKEIDTYMVYILTFCNGEKEVAIVVGHGRWDRAKVIFDDGSAQKSTNHIKAIFVRLYRKFGKGHFNQFIIVCNKDIKDKLDKKAESKKDAEGIERELHGLIGGNTRGVPVDIRNSLFNGISEKSLEWVFLKIALASSYDGIADLRKWRREGIIDQSVWDTIAHQNRLNLIDPLKKASAGKNSPKISKNNQSEFSNCVCHTCVPKKPNP